MHRLHGRHRLLQRARVGQADVLDGHADQAARDVHAVLAGLQHARQPVQRGVHVARAHGFVQRRDQVEVLFAALVVEQHLALHGVLHGLRGELARGRRGRGGFQGVVRLAPVAVGVDGDLLQQFVGCAQGFTTGSARFSRVTISGTVRPRSA